MGYRIFDILFPPREDEKLLQTVSDADFGAFAVPHAVPATRPETISLLPFHTPIVRAAIHEAKYHGTKRAQKLLARVLAEYLSAQKNTQKSILVPIPLSAARQKERGFNQVEAVVRRAIHGSEGSLNTALLKRTRDTRSQVSLPRHQREENMRGAFSAAHPIDPAVLYIVIDDVLTTGATLQAAVDALRAAGAKNILPLALAH